MEENASEIMQRITFSVVKYLETKTGVCNVKLHERTGTTKEALSSWEQKNSCLLPDDLKNYYLTTNGIKLTWSVKIDSSNPYPLGLMYLHPVDDIVEITGKSKKVAGKTVTKEQDSDTESEDEVSGLKKPSFTSSYRIFELDPCAGLGKVCLVYRNSHSGCSEIWFLDRSLRWHFLVATFTTYYRLMLLHLGLPQWQYIFTDIGLSMQAKQWFNIYAPSRIQTDVSRGRTYEHDLKDSLSVTPNQLDVSKVFKGKNEKKKPPAAQQINQMLKKRPVQNRQTGLVNPRLVPINQNNTLKGNK
ncbi:tubulin polyglutamylase complex subunit 2 [Octopus bimaculoides]|uniref:Knr4/Smi1-like domain-containing protein n=2 Tax=Octopus bimaculoides TaxID=37653 RepID=A0A0L8HKD4_OCTBM|nr:tubulin polyglutamylase complex subunit 2 [Octopus bimaculoides]|eukprot:XP_014771609.1 PREDICTED: tubulin polyglutamylase complex subunit 2-like [Octopus bimaculoides]